MKNIIIIMLVSLSYLCQGQDAKCGVLLKYDNVFAYIYKNSDGKVVIDSVINLREKDMLIDVTLEAISEKYAQITYISTLDLIDNKLDYKQGWIELGCLGINPAKSHFYLYESPCKSSKIAIEIEDAYWGDLYQFTKHCNGWLLIDDNHNGSQIKGWMSPEDQCPNPYTSCN